MNIGERQTIVLLGQKMEEAAAILDRAHHLGVDLVVIGDQLRLSGLESSVQRIAKEAGRLKPELIELLRELATDHDDGSLSPADRAAAIAFLDRIQERDPRERRAYLIRLADRPDWIPDMRSLATELGIKV